MDYGPLRQHLNQFSPIGDEDWNLLVPHLEFKTLKKGGLFAAEGRRARAVGFVLEGSLRQYYTREGEEKTTYFYFEGHLMSAYISCITGEPSQLTIEALTAVRYIEFPYQELNRLFECSMGWQRWGRRIAEYLALGLEERMVGLLTESPEARYLHLLASHRRKIMERIPLHYIANYLGITPVSMSRIRKRIQKNGG
jgi:CRP-like cAMP-binding protein